MDPININNISHMTDNELRAALVKFGEPVGPITPEIRHLYEEKLKKLIAPVSVEDQKNAFGLSSDLSNPMGKPEPVIQSRVIEADTYYGAFIPQSIDSPISEDVKKVYTEKTECVSVLKRYQGARFKGFPTYDEALHFSEDGPSYATVPPTPEKGGTNLVAKVNWEKPSPFRGPKSQELVKFRKAIEKSNLEYFNECVTSNPRFLVSSGDTPSILQEGSRYNSLHIACRNDKPFFCEKVLAIISNPEFFQRLYPDDSYESSVRRCTFLLDLYLNTPDKGFNETPLHFACKHGSLGCVKLLVSYTVCDTARLNKYNENPISIICSRVNNKSKEELSRKIKNVFEENYYVPVLRDQDNCMAPCIGSPWSPVAELETTPPIPAHVHSSPANLCSPISPRFKVKGYAGPMSPSKAETFYSRWKRSVVPSPSRNSKTKLAALRIEDHEKGLERVGRGLASEFSVDWIEFWPFLGTFCNLASLEGLQKLEEHLKQKYREVIEKRNEVASHDTLTSLKESLSSESANSTCVRDELTSNTNLFDGTRSSLSSVGDLCQYLEALRLNASLSPSSDTKSIPKKPILDTTYNHSLISSTSESCQNTPINNSTFNDSQDILNSSLDQYSFAVQSTRISAQRLSTILADISATISSHIGPDFNIARTLRNKAKPEIISLKMVLSKCLSLHSNKGLDFQFVHLFLSAKTVEHLMENITASNLYLMYETLKLLVGNINSFEEGSSDEEMETMLEVIDEEDRKEGVTHFHCVARGLERSLALAVDLIREGKEEKIDITQLEDCTCPWKCPSNKARSANSSLRELPVNVKKLNSALLKSSGRRNTRSAGSGGRFSRAHSFLHSVLFGAKKEEGESVTEEGRNKSDVEKVFESPSVVKHLSFDREEVDGVKEKEEEGKENEDEESAEDDDDDDDTESFTSAVSSLEEDNGLMATPEEVVNAYINGDVPSKNDFDVYVAIEELGVDEAMYPYVARWLQLMESHSPGVKKSWTSSCCGSRSTPSLFTSSPSHDPNNTSGVARKILFANSPI